MIRENQLLKLYGDSYKAMTIKLLEAAKLSELILAQKGSKDIRIGIKPNLVSPTPADMGATTHKELVAGLIEYLRSKSFDNITIMEGSWVGDRTEESFEVCGYRDLCRDYQVPFRDAQKEAWYEEDCLGLKLRICDCVRDVDFMINVPVLKGHGQTHMTCALKNMKGLIPNSEKRHFHSMGLHKPIAHLAAGIHQDFVLVDHICGDPGSEDGGNPVYTNCIMASRDPVLCDAYALELLGLKSQEVAYVHMAAELGLGEDRLDKAELICLNEDGDALYETCLAVEKSLPAKHRITDVYDHVEEVDSCSACYAYLIPALDRLEKEGHLEDLLAAIPNHKICIGQGYKGTRGHVGVGNCTRLFDHSVTGCPPHEDDIYEMLAGLLKN